MSRYIWQSESWPHLTWDNDQLIEPLSQCRLLQGKLLGRLASIDRKMGREACAELLVGAVPVMILYGRTYDKLSKENFFMLTSCGYQNKPGYFQIET